MIIAVIGGGAAGLMAALTASQRPEQSVLLLERQSRVGRKLLCTGNGRCNLTNEHLSLQHYHGRQPDFARYALQHFDAAKTLAWFEELGLFTTSEPSGRVYPLSNSANSVLDVLRLHLEARPNVTIRCGCEVSAITAGKRFRLQTQDGTLEADRVIVTCGGLAGSKVGGTRLGYTLLEQLGHRCTKLYPALVQIKTDPKYPRSLKGVRADAALTLQAQGKVLATRTGEVQFTEFGVSGPAAFDLSRAAATAGSSAALQLDFAPALSQQELTDALSRRCRQLPGLASGSLLAGMLHNRLGQTVLRYAGFSLTDPIGSLHPRQFAQIAAAVKQMTLPVTGVMGMDAAQVTAGGILTEEFDPTTMASRLVPGLYAAGEVLDIDGDCGGYNLQWAWSSGYLAGLLGTRGDKS